MPYVSLILDWLRTGFSLITIAEGTDLAEFSHFGHVLKSSLANFEYSFQNLLWHILMLLDRSALG